MVRTIDRAERRAVLAEAVWAVMRRDGFEAASVRAVAAEAGLATGSVRHFFTTQAELHRFAMEALVDRVAARVRAVLDQPDTDPTDRATRALLLLVPIDDELRADYLVHVAFLARSVVDPELAPLTRATYDALDGLYANVLEGLWGRDPGDAARRLGVLLDGLLLRMLMTPSSGDATWAEAEVRRFLATGGAA